MLQKLKDTISIFHDLLNLFFFFGLTGSSIIQYFDSKIFLSVATALLACALLAWLTYRFFNPVYIPLSEASRIIYENLRSSPFSKAADHLNTKGTPDGVLEYVATTISLDISIFGSHPPSTKNEKIGGEEFKRGTFENGAKSFNKFGSKSIAYSNLRVRKKDMRKAIFEIKKRYKKHQKVGQTPTTALQTILRALRLGK